MPFDEIISLERQLKNKRENLLLLQERMSQYALDTDVPLELVREEREHQTEIAGLERRIAELKAERGAQIYPDRPGGAPTRVWLLALGGIIVVATIASLWASSAARSGARAQGATQTAAAQAATISAQAATATLAGLPPAATHTPTPTPTETLPPYPYPSGPTSGAATPAPTLAADLTIAELEPMLAEVNIGLASSGSETDIAAVRSYFEGPDSAYHLLSVACLHLLHGHHLAQTVYLDMIDDYYTRLRGGEANYLTEGGAIDEETLARAIVAAYNDFYSENAAAFDELVVPGPNP